MLITLLYGTVPYTSVIEQEQGRARGGHMQSVGQAPATSWESRLSITGG